MDRMKEKMIALRTNKGRVVGKIPVSLKCDIAEKEMAKRARKRKAARQARKINRNK